MERQIRYGTLKILQNIFKTIAKLDIISIFAGVFFMVLDY